jgi:predicted nucleic acid-binding protein
MHQWMKILLIYKMNNILVDTGFWYALYNERDSFYWKANEVSEYLSLGKVIIPYPSLYETISTRFTKNSQRLHDFKLLLERENFELFDDNDYKTDALELTFNSALDLKRPLSLVDMIIRQMLSDKNLRINYLFSFNPGDFVDICRKRDIKIISDL